MELLFIKRPVLRAVCHSSIGNLISKYYKNQIPNRGCVIDTTSKAITPSLKASLYWGTYEKSEVLFVKRYLRPDQDVIELGSSMGVVSAHIARRLSATSKLICVEANPELIPSIYANVYKNAQVCQLAVVHAAIDYSGTTTVTLNIDQRNIDSRVSITGKNLVEVPALTVQEICKRFDVQNFSLVADIEGSESGILCYERVLIMEKCSQLIIELHDVNNDSQPITVDNMVLQLVGDYGFKLLQRRGNVFVFER
ncbi:MAG TPA: FkbM family methyltransferase [Anaerolineae bacterium]|nr:FkbM family methyltransferase [Anaerolineae bacterium]